MWGGPGDDFLLGDNIAGGPGDDVVVAGPDYLDGGSGNDRFQGDGVHGDASNGTGTGFDNGTYGADVILGRAGNDRIRADYNQYKDVELESGGDDFVDGGGGVDFCEGGPGTDTARRCEDSLEIEHPLWR